MITIEQKKDFKAWYKVWCETCPKTLEIGDTNEDVIGDDAITLLMATASRHERLHPTHNLFLLINNKKLPNET